jgi:hypothetical protein
VCSSDIRRVTLTARNHFIRDNIFYRSADAARIGFVAAYRWRKERRASVEQAFRPATTGAPPVAPGPARLLP